MNHLINLLFWKSASIEDDIQSSNLFCKQFETFTRRIYIYKAHIPDSNNVSIEVKIYKKFRSSPKILQKKRMKCVLFFCSRLRIWWTSTRECGKAILPGHRRSSPVAGNQALNRWDRRGRIIWAYLLTLFK